MYDFNFTNTFRKIIRLHFSLLHNELEKLGLYPGQPHLLMLIYHKDGLNQKEISEKLLLKPATTAVMLKRLEKNGFIYKSTDEEDLRVSRIHLTEKGIVSCVHLKEVSDNIDNICLKNFSDKDCENLNILLNKIKTNLEEQKR